MKKTRLIIVQFSISLLFLAFITNSCKKDDNSNNNSCSVCPINTFEVEIPNNQAIDLTEDHAGNTIILANNPDASLIKLNAAGEIIWSIGNTNIPDEAVSVEVLGDNSILVLSHAESEIISNNYAYYPHGIYIENFVEDWSGCYNYYQYTVQDSIPLNVVILPKTSISKFNSDGNFIWQKNFDGQIYETTPSLVSYDNDFFLATLIPYGKQGKQRYVTTDFGIVYMDTINYPTGKDSINIYKINSFGDILQTSNIKNVYSNYYSHVNLVKVNNKLAVKCKKEIIILDLSGNVQKRIIINPDWCNNDTWHMCYGGTQSIIVSGQYRTSLSNETSYIQKISITGNVEWETQNSFHFGKNISRNRYINKAGYELNMYDLNSNLLWSINKPHLNSIVNCRNGATLIEQSIQNQGFKVIRTDENGNY